MSLNNSGCHGVKIFSLLMITLLLERTKGRKFQMICDNCYHLLDCKKSPDEDGRCGEYLKDGEVEINEDVDVNPINTETFDYDDIKRLFGDIL
jgi:hypothetical protein